MSEDWLDSRILRRPRKGPNLLILSVLRSADMKKSAFGLTSRASHQTNAGAPAAAAIYSEVGRGKRVVSSRRRPREKVKSPFLPYLPHRDIGKPL
jgi:hypothetical protein